MQQSDLIECPKCGGYNIVIYELAWRGMEQTERGMSHAQTCESCGAEDIHIRCNTCGADWHEYDRTMSQFSGQFVDERLAILMRDFTRVLEAKP